MVQTATEPSTKKKVHRDLADEEEDISSTGLEAFI
jgi:hypothetical protein